MLWEQKQLRQGESKTKKARQKESKTESNDERKKCHTSVIPATQRSVPSHILVIVRLSLHLVGTTNQHTVR